MYDFRQFQFGHSDFRENLKVNSYLEITHPLATVASLRLSGHHYSYTEPIGKGWSMKNNLKIPQYYCFTFLKLTCMGAPHLKPA